jgi:hypothetical protein
MHRLASLARAAAPLAARASAPAAAAAPAFAAAAAAAAAPAAGGALCGRGDKRTPKGKRFKESNGTSRHSTLCFSAAPHVRSLGLAHAPHALTLTLTPQARRAPSRRTSARSSARSATRRRTRRRRCEAALHAPRMHARTTLLRSLDYCPWAAE